MECNTQLELDMLVKFDYSPGQSAITSGPINIQQPEEPESITITEVICKGIDILSHLTPEEIESLEDDCWQLFNAETEYYY